MCKKILAVCIAALFVTSVAFADGYYIVDSRGDMYRAERIERGYRPIEETPSLSLGDFTKGYIDTVTYSTLEPGYYYPNRDSNTLNMQLFNSEFACSLVAFGVDFYSEGWAEFYLWQGPDPIPPSTADLQTWLETQFVYDSATNAWTGMPPILYGPVLIGSDTPGIMESRTCWVTLSTPIDVGTSAVFGGYRVLTQHVPGAAVPEDFGGKPWPLSDAYAMNMGVPHYTPCRTWMFRIQSWPDDIRGWISYGDITGDWDMYWVINIYVNAGPKFVSYDRLIGTYITGPRTVNCQTWDFGVPAESSGTAEVGIVWSTGEKFADTVWMTAVSGDTLWAGDIPGQSAGTHVTYHLTATDLQGVTSRTGDVSYYVGGGISDNILLYLETDACYDSAWDAVNAVYDKVDTWDEATYGKADMSVFDFYTTGPGQRVIVWIAWQGYTFDANTASIASFLDAGGKLCLSGQDIFAEGKLGTELTGVGGSWGEWIAPVGSFARDYLKVKGGYDDYYGGDPDNPGVADTAVILYGITDDLISGDLPMIYQYPRHWYGYGYNYCGRFDSLDVGAEVIFTDGLGANMAYRYTDGYKLVVLYWSFNSIVLDDYSDSDTLSQNTLMRNIFDYFGVIGIEERPEPLVYKLPMVSPNPLSRPTTVSFSIPRTEHVSVKVYDVTGSVVSTLLNKKMTAGTHSLTIPVKSLVSGVYFLRMDAGRFSGTRKFVVTK